MSQSRTGIVIGGAVAGATLMATLVVAGTAGAVGQVTPPRGSETFVLREGLTKDPAGRVIGGWAALSVAAAKTGQAKTSGGKQALRSYPGGGTWDYSTYVDVNNYKHCWSFYYHSTKRHGATAIMQPVSARVDADAGKWAIAEPNPYWNPDAGTCYVYWRVY